jgi:hypothetical protein
MAYAIAPAGISHNLVNEYFGPVAATTQSIANAWIIFGPVQRGLGDWETAVAREPLELSRDLNASRGSRY